MWRLAHAAAPHAYRVRCTLRATDPWDFARVQEALQRVSERHEILRTDFRTLAGMTLPLQTPGNPQQAFPCLSIEPSSPPECFAHVDGHELSLSLSALCADGPTCLLMVAELVDAYSGKALAGDPLQFCDLAEWQHELLEDDAGEHDLWHGAVPTLSEPASGALPALKRKDGLLFSPAEWTIDLPPQAIENLGGIGAAHDIALSDLLLAAWTLLLWRLGNRTPVAFVADGRGDPDLDSALGPLARALPLLAQPQGFQSFLDLAREVVKSRESVCVIEHYVAPLASDASARFGFAPLAVPKLQDGFSLSRLSVRAEDFLVSLTARLHAEGTVFLAFDYDDSSLNEAAVSRLAEEYSALLISIAADPHAAIEQLNILGLHEREQVLQTFQGKTTSGPGEWQPVHRQVMQKWRYDRATVALQYGDISLTGDALVAQVERLAKHLAQRGVGYESRVGILLPRCIELVVAILAILETGAAYVPLDPNYPADRLNYMLADSNVELVITSSDLKKWHLDAATLQTICLDEDGPPDVHASIPDAGACAGTDVVYLLYTSGSTGRPKGVVIPHSALANHMDWMGRELPLLTSDVVLQKTALSFDASVWEFFAPLLAGARLVLAPPGAERDPQLLIAAIRTHGITIVQMVPTLLRMLLDEPEFSKCTSLRRVCCGGETLSPDLAHRFQVAMPGVELVNLYGPTESTIEVTSHQIQTGESSVSIGRPIDNARIYILDSFGAPLPIGVVGELHIGGAVLAKGYHNQPGLTAERFLTDPFHGYGNARMYRSGDIGAWREDGRLDYFGRGDQQIKLRGFRIEFGEIEAVAEAHTDVLRAAVTVTRDDGDIDQLICCYVLRSGTSLDPASLKTHLQRSLPEYMVPNWCIEISALPTTPAGKLDRLSLSNMRPALSGVSGTPRDPIEMRLVQIWEDVLKVYPIGIDANFFDLGGHSLLAVRLMSEVQREFGANLPLASLFAAQTIALQAGLLRNSDLQQDQILVPIRNTNKSKPPIIFVHPTGGAVLCYSDIARHLGDYPIYGLQDPGLQGEAKYESVEELAQLYIDRIEPLVGDHPYFLAGWSSGGVIAYAMASKLVARGRRVGMLAMIDSTAAEDLVAPPDIQRLLLSIARILAYHGGFELPTISSLSHKRALEDLLSLAKRAGVLPGDAELAQVERLFDVFRRNVEAIGRYRPPSFPRRALLLKATKPIPDALVGAAVQKPSELPAAGWERLCNVVVAEVGADHMSIVTEPHARSVASILLNEANEASRIYELDRQVMFPMLGV